MTQPILEIAHIEIKPGTQCEFIEAVRQAASLLQRASGCHSVELRQVIERPASFQLLVQWDSVAHHMVGFQKSSDFQKWRSLLGHFFLHTPQVDHSVGLIKSNWLQDTGTGNQDTPPKASSPG